MCLAVALPLLSFGIGAMQAVSGYQAQKRAADKQNQLYAENARNAQQAAVNNYAYTQNRIQQEAAGASQDITETRIQALQARGTARNAAGEAGVTGLSVDALVNDYYGREGRRVDSINTNYGYSRDALIGDMNNTQSTAQSRINSVQRADKPSFADAALRILGSGVSAFTMNQRFNNPAIAGSLNGF
jgi:hypothetical protein